MEKYNVNVNGKTYYVEIEVASEADAVKIETPAQEAPKQAVPMSSSSEGAEKIIAPIQGTINKISVSEGQTVKVGETLFVLEAMKMENDILATSAGVVRNISVKVGDSVSTQTVLAEIAK